MGRMRSLVVLVIGILLLAAPAAWAANEGAPWSAPDYLSVGDPTATAEGPSLAMLADGSLVATWSQDTANGWFPEIASEPFATGAWSSPALLSSTMISTPQDNISGVRMAASGSGKFVATWLAPNPTTPSQNDVDGAVGSVTPGAAPAFTPYTFAAYSAAGHSTFPYTPQVAMSSDGNGTVEYGIGTTIASAGTYVGLTGISAGEPDGTAGTPQAEFEYNPADGAGDYDKFVPSLAVSGLNADWNASLNDDEVLEFDDNGLFAQVDTTSNPAGWAATTPEDLDGQSDAGVSGEFATAAVLANGTTLLAQNYIGSGLNTWETGQASPTNADNEFTVGYPAVATYFDGSATIAYLALNSSTYTDTVKEVTLAANGTLSAPVTLSPGGVNISNLTDAYGPDGTTYVVWEQTDPNNAANDGIYASVRLPGGSFPTIPDTVIAGATVHPADPKIAVDATGFATIVAEVFEPNEGDRIAAFTHANPIPPRLLTNPAITPAGAPTVGTTLSCSKGTWANQPTTFAYQWLRAGNPIGGATASTYTVASADAGTSLSCQVTATNAYGSALGTSAAVTVATATAKSGLVTVGKTKTQNGKVLVPLSCPSSAAGCAPVTVTVTVNEQLVGKKVTAVTARAAKRRRRTRTVVIATLTVKLTPGEHRTVTLSLNGAGRTLLKSHHRLPAALTIASGTTRIAASKLTLTPAAKPRHR